MKTRLVQNLLMLIRILYFYYKNVFSKSIKKVQTVHAGALFQCSSNVAYTFFYSFNTLKQKFSQGKSMVICLVPPLLILVFHNCAMAYLK